MNKISIEESANQYFLMPDKVFNSGTGCHDNTAKSEKPTE